MESLRKLDLVAVLKDVASADKPFMGICLGLQLLMDESHEFGSHAGLGVLKGTVVRFEAPREHGRTLKVPQIGWNQIVEGRSWSGTPLEGLSNSEFMYFVHSYVAQPSDPEVLLSRSRYGEIEFCSSVHRGNLFACQFHPEKSGPAGLRIYGNFSKICSRTSMEAAARGR